MAEDLQATGVQPPEGNELQAALRDTMGSYPFLAQHPWSVTRGSGPYQSEFYPSWESHNPIPGQNTIELQNPNWSGAALRQLLPAEMLHLVGAINPNTQEPVSPAWFELKRLFQNAMTPGQQDMNQHSYQQSGDSRPFDDWMQQSRTDAFLRAGLFPAINPGWAGVQFSPEQHSLLAVMQHLLTQPPIPLGP